MCMTGLSRRQSPCRGVMKMERKALFLDMDGTTLNDDVQIPKENYEAMEAAIKVGHEIVITTGRPLASARILLKKWDLERIGLRRHGAGYIVGRDFISENSDFKSDAKSCAGIS